MVIRNLVCIILNYSTYFTQYEYKRRHRDMTGKGYTFIPDTPSQMHAEEISHTQSEVDRMVALLNHFLFFISTFLLS